MEEFEIKEIDAETFVKMFVAVCYTHEQRYFNVEHFLDFLAHTNLTDCEIQNQIIAEINNLIGKELEPIETADENEKYENLYFITKEIDFLNIIRDNKEYLNELLKFFLIFNNAESGYKTVDVDFGFEFTSEDKNKNR
jgi:hypothetical protein